MHAVNCIGPRAGVGAIVPKQPDRSELLRRVQHPDVKKRMPIAVTLSNRDCLKCHEDPDIFTVADGDTLSLTIDEEAQAGVFDEAVGQGDAAAEEQQQAPGHLAAEAPLEQSLPGPGAAPDLGPGLRSLGLPEGTTAALSEAISQLLEDVLDISPKRVFINFFDLEHSKWGWNGGTFG